MLEKKLKEKINFENFYFLELKKCRILYCYILCLSLQVFAVGVGNGVDKTELNTIATDPDSTHVLTVANFQQLSKITATLNNQACNGMCTLLDRLQYSMHYFLNQGVWGTWQILHTLSFSKKSKI